MVDFFGLLLALAAVYGLAAALLRADPAGLARAIKMIVPALFALIALASAALGRPGIGALFAVLAALIIWRMRRSHAPEKPKGSLVRASWLELEISVTSGDLGGTVLAGEFEGRSLGALSDQQLLLLYRAMESDAESRGLLEAYLDRRMPAWAGDANFDVDLRQGAAPGAGSMTDQEAYQILGLHSGAGAADISEAHRRLTQRMRGSAAAIVLISRIDEARNVLLARHH